MLKTVVQGLLDLLWPPLSHCLLCQGILGDPGEHYPVCAACWDEIAFDRDRAYCFNCARPLKTSGDMCLECEESTPFGYVFALGLLEGALREAVHHLKFNAREDLARLLGRRLGATISIRPDYILPVPLHPSRLRERGYNQATLIANGIASELFNVPVLDGTLRRLRRTGHQAKLDRDGRLHNLQGAFGLAAATPPWVDKDLLLVDDVLTTGATATAVAAVLRGTGARSVNLAVLAVSSTPVRGNLKNRH